MRTSGIIIGIAALAISQWVSADVPAPEAKALGTIEAILDHCAKVDPADAASYQKRVQLVTQGASEETLAKVRKTDEYQQAHDSTVESLAAVKEPDAKKACAQSLTDNG